MSSLKRVIDYVDVFYGSGEIALPEPEGIASTWRFLKAQCGNTFPHAAYPFGRMTCGVYTGGYPTGYGNHKENGCGPVPKFDAKLKGITHLHQSGTGGIRAYYNYALTTPLYGELCDISDELMDESGTPGYYSCTFKNSGIKAELTVSEKVAFHRYHFNGDGKIQIDFSNGGLITHAYGRNGRPTNAEIEIKNGTVLAKITALGTPIYFAASCDSAKKVYLWKNYKVLDDKRLCFEGQDETYGCAFDVENVADVKIGVSNISYENAVSSLNENELDFDSVKHNTENTWDGFLSAINVESKNEDFLQIFYSNLYHSLIKPSKWDEKYNDFATMWDLYKTQLPLVFSLYGKQSREITESLIEYMSENEYSPININLADNNDMPDQARMLMEFSLADSFWRGINDEPELTLKLAQKDLLHTEEMANPDTCPRYTYILDISEACNAMLDIAVQTQNEQMAQVFKPYIEVWEKAYDHSTGLLSTKSNYYEGDEWNYSFRLLKNMEKRIALAGGREEFIGLLDNFFGYTREPAAQLEEATGKSVHSFEGYNNEPDMETPYAYIYADRHDKTCEVLRSGMKYMFTTGKGGLPGNNDSGGLSSCYVWNAMGIFPVTGQNLMLIGSPMADKTVLKLANGKEFEIIAHDNSEGNIYVQRAVLNGKVLDKMMFTVNEFIEGGKLELYMSRDNKNN